MFKFVIEPDDGDKYEVVAKSRDVVQWEKTGKNRSVIELQRSMKFSDVYSLAHVAARRAGMFTGTLQEFEGSVDLEVLPEEEADPTPEAR